MDEFIEAGPSVPQDMADDAFSEMPLIYAFLLFIN